jgi:type IV secretory pathway VirD2 relaxase
MGNNSRRAVIKLRIAKLKPGKLAAPRAHMRYIQRDGVTLEGERGQLYSKDLDIADGAAFTERCDGDRHQFRIIVSPDDAEQLADLKPFVRDLMTDMEKDLGTNLDWVAVDHFNTGHFHTHIVIRGKDEDGKDLIIARDYITHGIRERASQLLTLELGPEDDFAKTLKLVRQIDPDIERKLRQLGQRDDIQKTMYRAMREAGIDQPAGEFAIFKTNEPNANVIGEGSCDWTDGHDQGQPLPCDRWHRRKSARSGRSTLAASC